MLPGLENDIRTVDKLINGVNETYDDRNMWISPFITGNSDDNGKFAVKTNTLILSFDKPIMLSCINFWNYSKTPSRGAREIEIYLDDSIIYRVDYPFEIGFNSYNRVISELLQLKMNLGKAKIFIQVFYLQNVKI